MDYNHHDNHSVNYKGELHHHQITCTNRLADRALKNHSIFHKWMDSGVNLCTDVNRSIATAYANEFVHLKHVIVDPSKYLGQGGGKDVSKVLNQQESLEYYKLKPGSFALSCKPDKSYRLNVARNHINDYLHNTETIGKYIRHSSEDLSTNSSSSTKLIRQPNFTIVVTRYEYANLYHTMTDWYNAYLMMNFFNKSSSQTNILIVDCHPSGTLDTTWSVIFNSSRRLKKEAGDLDTKLLFPQMVWSILGYNSPMYVKSEMTSLPLVDDFRQFFLTRHCVNPDHVIDCESLNVVFIWRHDYIAHPRNPTGKIKRKIANEEELLLHTRSKYPMFNITGLQLDELSMGEQLQYIASTDVLVGMHGAGLTHAMFLPKHASLIELAPSYGGKGTHFNKIAKWRGIHYQKWFNSNSKHEKMSTFSTYIDTSTLNTLIEKSVNALCSV